MAPLPKRRQSLPAPAPASPRAAGRTYLQLTRQAESTHGTRCGSPPRSTAAGTAPPRRMRSPERSSKKASPSETRRCSNSSALSESPSIAGPPSAVHERSRPGIRFPDAVAVQRTPSPSAQCRPRRDASAILPNGISPASSSRQTPAAAKSPASQKPAWRLHSKGTQGYISSPPKPEKAAKSIATPTSSRLSMSAPLGMSSKSHDPSAPKEILPGMHTERRQSQRMQNGKLPTSQTAASRATGRDLRRAQSPSSGAVPIPAFLTPSSALPSCSETVYIPAPTAEDVPMDTGRLGRDNSASQLPCTSELSWIGAPLDVPLPFDAKGSTDSLVPSTCSTSAESGMRLLDNNFRSESSLQSSVH